MRDPNTGAKLPWLTGPVVVALAALGVLALALTLVGVLLAAAIEPGLLGRGVDQLAEAVFNRSFYVSKPEPPASPVPTSSTP